MDTQHEIFRAPFPVELTWEEVETPANYRRYFDGEGLGETIRVWRVQTELEHKNYGLVSDGYRFADSPDAEYISGGLNSKNPGALALGRQGNWFLWGFVARPDEMTGSARTVFLNTIAYMAKFDGRRALRNKTSSAREWALNYPRFYEGDKRREYVQRNYDAALLATFDADPDRFEQYLADNLGYLYRFPKSVTRKSGEREYTYTANVVALDADARALGIANHDLRLLERCVADLERGAEPARAQRLLERYTDQKHGADARAWRAWLDGHRDRLYFCDAFGYRFFVDDRAAAARVALQVTGGQGLDPVALKAELAGDKLVLLVEVEPSWHIYPPGSDLGMPIQLEFVAGSGYRAAGAMRITEGRHGGELSGRVRIEIPVARTTPAKALRAEFQYQACDPTTCLEPVVLTITAK